MKEQWVRPANTSVSESCVYSGGGMLVVSAGGQALVKQTHVNTTLRVYRPEKSLFFHGKDVPSKTKMVVSA